MIAILGFRVVGGLLLLGCAMAALDSKATFAGSGFVAGAIFLCTSSILEALATRKP